MRRLVVLVLALGAALAASACEEKKSTTDTPRLEAGADKYATADPKLEKALQAVASSSTAMDNGPPPSGVFAAGGADQRHARGVPSKVELVADGAEPRVLLTPPGGAAADAARSTSYGPAELGMVLQLGPQSVSAVSYSVVLGPAKKDDGGPDWLVADVKRAAPMKDMGEAVPGADKDIASLAGTQIRVQLTPDGRESDMQTRLGKAAKAELNRLAESAAEALVLSTVPLPTKPIGVGAQWIAETRMLLFGLDVVAYRAYRAMRIEGNRVHLSVDVKAYAASRETQLAEVPKGSTLEQFDAQAKGELDLVRGETLARKADLQERIVMVFSQPGAPPAAQAGQPGQPQGNLLPAQIQSQATFRRGEDLRAASRQP